MATKEKAIQRASADSATNASSAITISVIRAGVTNAVALKPSMRTTEASNAPAIRPSSRQKRVGVQVHSVPVERDLRPGDTATTTMTVHRNVRCELKRTTHGHIR